MGITQNTRRAGVVCALAGLGVFGAISKSAFAHGWADAEAGRPIFQSFLPNEIPVKQSAQAIRQDPNGMLYFGSENLLQFGGTTWRRSQTDADRPLRGIDIDGSGTIWVGGFGTIGYFKDDGSGQLQFTSLLPQLPGNDRDNLVIWGVEATSRGVVFSATDKILRWDGKSFQIWPLKEARRAMSQRIGDTVYVTHLTTGLWKVAGDKPELIIPYDPTAKILIGYLKPLDHDSFLAVTTQGLGRLDGSKLSLLSGDCGPFLKANILTCAT